jgi:IS5 family transposase
MEEALIELPTMSRFAGIALIIDRDPDQTTILNFRYLLEEQKLGVQIFETLKAHLSARGTSFPQGFIVNLVLIGAPSFTKDKNESGIRNCTRPRKVISGISA